MKSIAHIRHALLIALLFGAASIHAETDSASQSNSPAQSKWPATEREATFNQDDGLALHGYDPVAYFDGQPAKGQAKLTATYRGISYRFASEANRKRFLADPARFEPAFGGWCAWAMADDGSKVDINPQSYKIVDGRLFVFYDGFWGDTRKLWNQNPAAEPSLARRATENWRKASGHGD